MVIKKDNQLGLRVLGKSITEVSVNGSIKDVPHLTLLAEIYELQIKGLNRQMDLIKQDRDAFYIKSNMGNDIELTNAHEIIKSSVDNFNVIPDFIFLITKGVYFPSAKIKIGENFTTASLSNMKFGRHSYLMGRDKFCLLDVSEGLILGSYIDIKKSVAFKFLFDLKKNSWYSPSNYVDEFSEITKIIVFINLGDIEVTEIERNKSNGKSKKEGKIVNKFDLSVFVVDSSWNQLIIRSDGFAVSGHFRMQPCGKGMLNRKLIWINAFQKKGYVRKPKNAVLA